MYIADSANELIRTLDLTTLRVTTIAGMAGVAGWADGVGTTAQFNKPNGLLLDGAGHLYVAESNGIDVRTIDLTTLRVTRIAGKPPDDPRRICESVNPIPPQPPECDWVDAPNGLDARFRFPFGVASDGKGGMYLADSHNDVVRHVDLASTAITTVAGVQQTILDDIPHGSTDSTPTQPGTFWHLTHVVPRGPQTLLVSDRGANCIRRVDLAPR
jgi:sugar lactone lactonase YvrE